VPAVAETRHEASVSMGVRARDRSSLFPNGTRSSTVVSAARSARARRGVALEVRVPRVREHGDASQSEGAHGRDHFREVRSRQRRTAMRQYCRRHFGAPPRAAQRIPKRRATRCAMPSPLP
jgi:hypothetical protein